MARRTGWRSLSPGYRKQLERQGVTQQQWQSGAPLPRRRSGGSYDRLTPRYKDKLAHEGIGREEYGAGYTLDRPPPLTPANVRAASRRVAAGEERRQDIGLLRRWYGSDAPQWVRNQPGLNKVATAATLYNIGKGPRAWESVSFTPTKDAIWTATVTFKDGETKDIEVPGYVVQDMRAWLAREEIANDIGGTP